MDLVFLGVLKPEYPYSINSKSAIFEEFLVYGISSTAKIAEIGAGVGSFSLLLNRIQPQVKVYINELDDGYLTCIRQQIKQNVSMFDTMQLQVVKGEKKATGLEGLGIDKIIIRNSFHHFKEQAKMLESIRKSLRSDGTLYLLESVSDQGDKTHTCKQLLSRQNILDRLTDHGFRLEQDFPIGSRVCFIFKPIL